MSCVFFIAALKAESVSSLATGARAASIAKSPSPVCARPDFSENHTKGLQPGAKNIFYPICSEDLQCTFDFDTGQKRVGDLERRMTPDSSAWAAAFPGPIVVRSPLGNNLLDPGKDPLLATLLIPL